MYRSSSDPIKKKAAESLTNFLDLNGLNMECFEDMYLNTCSSMSVGSKPTPSTSPSSSSGASETGSFMSPVSMFKSAYHSPNTTPTGFEVGATIENMAAIQQQQLLAAHQQQLAAAAFAKHQIAMDAAGGNHHNINLAGPMIDCQQDEISKSLKMFAMLTAYTNITEPTALASHLYRPPVESVMQDFACNGYICDDLSRLQLGMHLSNNIANDNTANHHNGFNDQHHMISKGIASNKKYSTENSTLNQQYINPFQQQQNFNINFNNNFWKSLPTHAKQHSIAVAAAAAATTTAAANIDYNCNQKKLSKRYNSSKNEKYTSAKHCVFCENNNEAEAVVKSHAVRDSLGRVLCPKLRTYVCPICKASGDMAHTVKYCPQKPIITMEDAIKAESLRLARGTFYKPQMKV